MAKGKGGRGKGGGGGGGRGKGGKGGGKGGKGGKKGGKKRAREESPERMHGPQAPPSSMKKHRDLFADAAGSGEISNPFSFDIYLT